MLQSKNVDSQILNYLGQLSDKKKQAVLSVVKTFAEESITLWDIMPEEVRKGVEKSLEQSQKGIGRKHQDVMKQYIKWLEK
jgi:hypothetical protein